MEQKALIISEDTVKKYLTPEDVIDIVEKTEVSYRCYCSRERVEAALISLGKKELEEIAQEGKPFPVECQFCDTIYEFTPDDIKEILKNI